MISDKPSCSYGQGFAFAVLLLLGNTGVVYGLELEDLFKRKDQRAIELLESGQAEAAASEFTDPLWRGVSRYKAGLYQEAMQDFSQVEDAKENAKALYNYGTAAARAGDYSQSVESLTKALELAPQDADIAHNLDVAKQLKDLAEQQPQQSDQQQKSESEENSDSAESEQQKDSQDSQDGQQGDESEPSEGEQSESERRNPSEDQSESNESGAENSGDVSTNEQDQSADSQDQAEEDLREMMQQEQNQAQSSQDEQLQEQDAEPLASEPESVSENDQATEQWLRRIDDDPSQLLRNKIRLNHLIEYPQVNDMQEPW